MLLVLALATASAVVVAELAVATVERAHAQTAADAAALAGAAAGEGAARVAAVANGAEVTRYRVSGAVVAVEVAYRRARAAASAEALAARPADARAGLAPVLVAALARADQLLGRRVPVVAGHDDGMVAEVPEALVPALLAVAEGAGLCRPAPEDHPVHFAPCPTSPA